MYVLEEKNKERYFHNAQRVRRLVVDKWNELFEKYDAVILPIESAKKIDDKEGKSLLENHLAIGTFGGFPSITIPNGFVGNLPTGICITGKCYDDINVLNIAYALEEYKNQIVGGVK